MDTKKVCVYLAVAISKNEHLNENPYKQVIQEVNKVNEKYSFQCMMKRCSTFTSNVQFETVVEKMLRDKQINWGRIIVAFAISRYVSDVKEWGNFLANTFSEWIDKNGGWAAFSQTAFCQTNVESCIKYALGTFLLVSGAVCAFMYMTKSTPHLV